jgi:large subunit ribosomal protein L13
MDLKLYDRYTGFPSGRHVRTARVQMGIDPTEMVIHAVKGMLPKNKLGRQMIKKLKVYAGSEHPHVAQKPEALELKI